MRPKPSVGAMKRRQPDPATDVARSVTLRRNVRRGASGPTGTFFVAALLWATSMGSSANAGVGHDGGIPCTVLPCPAVTDFNNCHPAKGAFSQLIALPYRDDGLIYGYFDFCPGRGPVVTLGDGTLQPGFRGYGMFGSPGYGRGLTPTSAIDRSRYSCFPCIDWLHESQKRPKTAKRPMFLGSGGAGPADLGVPPFRPASPTLIERINPAYRPETNR
jgi:hypothetical protein